jgi:hypothetical protein
MKLFVYTFIVLAAVFASAPVFAQVTEAEAELLKQMPADEDGWAAQEGMAEEAGELEAEADAHFHQEQNPHDVLRDAKTAPAAKGTK